MFVFFDFFVFLSFFWRLFESFFSFFFRFVSSFFWEVKNVVIFSALALAVAVAVASASASALVSFLIFLSFLKFF